MNRRDALKSMAISVWGMMVVPGCGPGQESSISTEDEFRWLPLNSTQKKNLESMVDTFIPKTDTLGAVELDVHRFIDRLLANCYEEEIQNSFIAGLDHLENLASDPHNKSFYKCSRKERETILLTMESDEEEEIKQFFDQAKELTILGFTTSEYYLTHFTSYDMAPGGYEGCLPVPDRPFKV
ncbi:gluconate 2-dehydrogenase subunit 3 family protein [Negadavirga shengliensis]|uniref:Gluconate 2-dehydrogenase subunit 3 family protein n=1 Tax=Negadavirga shengliensis TaxID=1389218 RepID=A0ABV9SZ73_9BACT